MSSRPLGWALALLFVSVTDAQAQRFWSFLEPGRVVQRCTESSGAHRQAQVRLESLEQKVEQLRNVDPPDAIVAEIHALLKTECFLPAAETERIPRPDTGLSLIRWWNDGGFDWLASFLELPRQGRIDDVKPYVIVPPDARPTLNFDAHRDHPLRRFLCQLSSASCGASTRGWRQRAEVYFDSHQVLFAPGDTMSTGDRPASGDGVTSRECAEKASASELSGRYQTWRGCVEERRPRTTALPLGEFNGPTDGWLVIAGRRGHHEFCDTTRAYNLATGAAYISESCSNLALKSGGIVDVDRTDAARVLRVSAGRVPVQNLQEAVWMLLFRDEVQAMQLRAQSVELPSGMVPQLKVREPLGEGIGGGLSVSTAQTTINWRWVPRVDSGFVGQLTWPGSFEAAEDHAAKLLNVAEGGFVEGCAVRPLPAPQVLITRNEQRLNDVRTEDVEQLNADVALAFVKWKALHVCQ